MDLLRNGKHQVGTRFEICLRVADQQVRRYHACAYEAANEHPGGTTDYSADNHAASRYAAIHHAIAFQTRAGSNDSF